MRIFIEVNEEQYKKLKKLYKGTNNDVTFICGDKIEKIKTKKMTKKEWDRRWNKTTKEILEMYRKSFPFLLKSYHDVEYNEAIKRSWEEVSNMPIPKEKKKLIDKMFK